MTFEQANEIIKHEVAGEINKKRVNALREAYADIARLEKLLAERKSQVKDAKKGKWNTLVAQSELEQWVEGQA